MADVFLIFTGWTLSDVEKMPFSEFVEWYNIAIDRYEKSKQQNGGA